jgi:F-type H+-transporting ATPase subunit epsilon
MANQLHIEIVTHDGITFEGEADGLIAPGTDGYFGMLPHHAPLIAELGIGDLRVRLGSDWRHFAISGGILHLRDSRVLIMADAAEPSDAIDLERARAAMDRAKQRLAHRGAGDIDMQRAEVALVRAINRMRVAGQSLH